MEERFFVSQEIFRILPWRWHSLTVKAPTIVIIVLWVICMQCWAELPKVTIEDVPAPASASTTVSQGTTLAAVARMAYGHEKFAGFVARVNDVSNPEKIADGIIIKTPSLSAAFRDVGVDPYYQGAINVLAKASVDFFAILPAYLKIRYGSHDRSQKLQVSPEICSKFNSCADSIDAAIQVLAAPKAEHHAPRKAIGQFQQVSSGIRELVAGSMEPNGYDYSLVEQRLGLAFTDLIIWVQTGYQ